MYTTCCNCLKPIPPSLEPEATCSPECTVQLAEFVRVALRKDKQKDPKPTRGKRRRSNGEGVTPLPESKGRQISFAEYEIDQLPEKKPRKRKQKEAKG